MNERDPKSLYHGRSISEILETWMSIRTRGSPIQILYLNVVTDVFLAHALGVGEGNPDVMKRPPCPRDESVLTRGHWTAVGGWVLLLAVCVLSALVIAFYGLDFNQRPRRYGFLSSSVRY
jgi:magnesium-transporting ATPase (P-type)